MSTCPTRQHEGRTRSDGYWRDLGWSRSSQGHLRGHRDTARRRPGEIRARQGVGGAHGRSLPTHRHVLSGELWLHQTLSADGDPRDVLVVTQVQVVPGAIVRCRPVGALLMEDDAGHHEKIIAVPVDALAPFYADIRNYRDLPPIMCEQIAHFFQHYKDLENGKWVTIVKWLDVTGAEKLILEAIARAKKAQAKGHVGRRATQARTRATRARAKARSKK